MRFQTAGHFGVFSVPILCSTVMLLSTGCGGSGYEEQFKRNLQNHGAAAPFLVLEDSPSAMKAGEQPPTIRLPKATKGSWEPVNRESNPDDVPSAANCVKGLSLEYATDSICKLGSVSVKESWADYTEFGGEIPIYCIFGSIDPQGKSLAQIGKKIEDTVLKGNAGQPALKIADRWEEVTAKTPPDDEGKQKTIGWMRMRATCNSTVQWRQGTSPTKDLPCTFEFWITQIGNGGEVLLVAWRVPDDVAAAAGQKQPNKFDLSLFSTAAGTLVVPSGG